MPTLYLYKPLIYELTSWTRSCFAFNKTVYYTALDSLVHSTFYAGFSGVIHVSQKSKSIHRRAIVLDDIAS